MWTCQRCSRQVEDEEDFCYYCGSPATAEQQEATRARARRLDNTLACPRCRTKMRYGGLKKFHEGSRGWGFWLGDLGELFTHREEFDVYVCPKCGKVELFVDGVGEEYRSERHDE